MTIIEITPNEYGGHANQTTTESIPVPPGWALLPESVGTPDTLPNFPFGAITVDSFSGVPTVTHWTPLPIPEPEPAPTPEPAYSAEDMIKALIGA